MQKSEEAAQQALKFLELAYKFEEEKNIENSVEYYKKAVGLLKESGYLMHRIGDIYERIEELEEIQKKEKIYQQINLKTQEEHLQTQAFMLLDAAKQLESEGFIEDSIEKYNSAIKLLGQSGWSESQLENLKRKIKNVAEKWKKEQKLQNQQKQSPPEEYVTELRDQKPEIVGMFGHKASIEKKESIAQYRSKKKKEEETQDDAFSHLDKAKLFEAENNYYQAILNYERAMELLNSIGWNEQSKNIQVIINKLKKDRDQFTSIHTQLQQSKPELDVNSVYEKSVKNSETESKKVALIEFVEKKKREEYIQSEAFNLIDIGKRLEREKNFEQAILKFEQAIKLFISIKWDSYIQPIINLIEDIKRKKDHEQRVNLLQEKRQKELEKLQNSIIKRNEEVILKTAEELDLRKKIFEEKRKKLEASETTFFNILENADDILKGKKFEEAIDEYQKALTHIENLGPKWETYVHSINNTILNIQRIKNVELEKDYKFQQKLENREKSELDFQKQIIFQLNKERGRLKQKEIVFKDQEKQIIYFEQQKNIGFEFLDSGIEAVKQRDYESAIEAYQNAGKIFAEIQWNEEIPLIENSIKEVEELKKNQNLLKQKRIAEAIERHKKDEEFQNQIARYLQLEREKVKERQVQLKKRNEEKKILEEKTEAGFKLLEQAQDEMIKGEFNAAIEILQYAINFFADAQWQDEISIIKNSILEIKNKKREVELQDQIKFRAKLEGEKQERVFQELITIESKSQQDKLKQKEITLREREKEIAYREQRRTEAFGMLETAQKLVSTGNYDDVLEIYYEVLKIFAQIHWIDEIPILQESIQEIKKRKGELELFKYKQIEKSIKKEAVDKAFLDQIKYQRERERVETSKNLDHMEKLELVSTQNLAKQQEAFKMIEDGEIFLQEENFDKAVKSYQDGIKLLIEVGWGPHYIRLLEETIKTVQNKKIEKEIAIQKEFELSLKRQKKEELFQEKIKNYLKEKQEELKEKEIKIQKQEELLTVLENNKIEAFDIMEEAKIFLNQGNYVQSIEKFRQAEFILSGLGFPTEIIKETIQEIQERIREEDINKFKEMELTLRQEYENSQFQQKIVEKVKLEEYNLREKQRKLKELEENRLKSEEERDNAFEILEEAQTSIEKKEFDKAIDLYKKTSEIFLKIQWHEEIKLIQNSIRVVEAKKKEADLERQKLLDDAIKKEKLETKFQKYITKEMVNQREKLKQKEIIHRKKEIELSYREKQKNIAFNLLDKAQILLSQQKYEEALESYFEVANIFAQIQWVDEIPIIKDAIKDIERKRNEMDKLKQRLLEKAIKDERADYSFRKQIQIQKAQQRIVVKRNTKNIERQKLQSSKFLIKQQEAFKLIEDGELLLKQNKIEQSLKNYNIAIKLLTEIGWTPEYMKLLYGTVNVIKRRKSEIVKKKNLEQKLLMDQQAEEIIFNEKVTGYLEKEKERFRNKKIDLQIRENNLRNAEKRKTEAFGLMDNAEESLNNGQYKQTVELYRQAELKLNEIGFPTGIIKNMIQKVLEKNREDNIKKQREFERKLQNEREELKFLQKSSEALKINEMKNRARQIEIKKEKEKYDYLNKRKDEAFDLLEEAEIYVKNTQYHKSIEYYHSAELILNEIAFPTEGIRDSIQKIKQKSKEHKLQKQKDLESKILKEKEEFLTQQKITKQVKIEKERLRDKKIQISKIAAIKDKLEERKGFAFKMLDEAEGFFKNLDYDQAIATYRKAELVLNELQYPTDSINGMIGRINQLVKEKEQEKVLMIQRNFERLKAEKDLNLQIEERKRLEMEKKKAQLLAYQEKEKLIQENKNVRESAYTLLEDAGKLLKERVPDYEKAISLYKQARNILSENIGWDPEISNLDALVKDLQKEQINYQQRKKLVEETRILRQKEYDIFQEEIRNRRFEQEKLKREQERQFKNLMQNKRRIEKFRDDGLKYIDEGKKWAAYHDFDKAFKFFNKAKSKFVKIDWINEINYIEAEIKNTKILEEKVRTEELKITMIQEELNKQRILEESRRKFEVSRLKETVSEVSELADEVVNLIERKKVEQKLVEKQEKIRVLNESKEYSKKLGQLIKIKEELIKELGNKEEQKKEFQEKLQNAKDREKINNLKRMIKETSEKKKK